MEPPFDAKFGPHAFPSPSFQHHDLMFCPANSGSVGMSPSSLVRLLNVGSLVVFSWSLSGIGTSCDFRMERGKGRRNEADDDGGNARLWVGCFFSCHLVFTQIDTGDVDDFRATMSTRDSEVNRTEGVMPLQIWLHCVFLDWPTRHFPTNVTFLRKPLRRTRHS